jgi:hypothetical protein
MEKQPENIFDQEASQFQFLMDKLVPIIVQYHKENKNDKQKVIEYLPPKELQKAIDFTLGEKSKDFKEILVLI